MTNPSAAGERFLATAGHFMSVAQMAQTLRDRLGHAARAVSTRQLPNWLLRAVALFDPEVRSLLPELGKRKDATVAKAQRLLGWNPRPPEEAIIATATSLAELNLLKSCQVSAGFHRVLNRPVKIPTLALGSDVGSAPDIYESMKPLCEILSGGQISSCGHYILEEQPERRAAELVTFFNACLST